jgi:hypothetical protein
MNASSPKIFYLAGALCGFAVVETWNTVDAAKNRLTEIADAANTVAIADPRSRLIGAKRFVITDAPLPELMDAFTGQTLVGIVEQ